MGYLWGSANEDPPKRRRRGVLDAISEQEQESIVSRLVQALADIPLGPNQTATVRDIPDIVAAGARDVAYPLLAGRAAGFLGTPGDLQSLLPGMQGAMVQLPTSEGLAAQLGLDPSSPLAQTGMVASAGALDDALARALKFVPLGITAFHGSPHLFDKFKMSQIGTGEGAQAYGHGLYFAEKKGTAKYYADALAGAPYDPGVTKPPAAGTVADRLMEAFGGDGVVWDRGSRNIEEVAERLSVGGIIRRGDVKIYTFEDGTRFISTPSFWDVAGPSPGALYEVEIPDSAIDNMLDLDKPLSQQPESVRRVFFDDWLGTENPGVYHRYTRSETPEYGGKGGMMFFSDDPNKSRHYGPNHFVFEGDSVPVHELESDIRKILADNPDWWEHTGATSVDQVIDQIDPGKIVSEGGWWDSDDFVYAVWNEILEPRGISAVRTSDGLLLFDPSQARRVYDVDPLEDSGRDLYNLAVEAHGSPEVASEALRAAGIPGNKYLDAGSRSAGEGSYNFVVFDEDIIKILNRE